MELSENFKVREFACKDGSDKVLVCSELVSMLQAIRSHYGKPVAITSGYRTATYNVSIKGAKDSYHVKGMAADFTVKDVSPTKVRSDIEAGRIAGVASSKIGLGYYASFTHVDSRGKRSRF